MPVGKGGRKGLPWVRLSAAVLGPRKGPSKVVRTLGSWAEGDAGGAFQGDALCVWPRTEAGRVTLPQGHML